MRRRDGETQVEPEWLTWLKGTLTDRGYDVTSPRGGGKARLAEATGLAQSTVSRIMSGQAPDYDSQLVLSRHLGVPLAEMLIRTGKATGDDFPATGVKSSYSAVSSGNAMTPEELARAAGVPEGDRDWFTTMIRRFRRTQPGDDSAEAAEREG